ncbi:MAG: M16 family metallopeptidase [Anaerolineae bacterium]
MVVQAFDNGVTLVLQPRDTSAAVSLGGRLNFGTYLDPHGQPGLTHLTSSMLRRGTQAHTFQQINQALDRVGASLGVSSGRDTLSIGGRCLGDDLGLLLDLLEEMLRAPSFDERELSRMRGQLLTSMAELDTDPSYRAALAFIDALYTSEHPYGRPMLGTASCIRGLEPEDVRGHYAQHMHPEGAVFAIVGSFEPEWVIERFGTTLGAWRPAAVPARWTCPPTELPLQRVYRTIEIPARPQLDVMYGVLGMRRHAPDYYAATVVNVVLAELGMMGRLGATIRDEKGLVYDIDSSLLASQAPRHWVISAGVDPQHLAATITATDQVLERMREELISESELEDARNLLIGSLPLQMETNEGIASYLMNAMTYKLGIDFVERYPDLIGSVTAEQVREVMRRYWVPGREVITVAGTLTP